MAGTEQLAYHDTGKAQMYEGLVPCSLRTVDEGGRILCGLIKIGDREVSVNLCRSCPVPQINCQHLRAAMKKNVSTPITVRFATGRVEIWDDEAPTIGFRQAACAVKTMPINSPRDCTGCPLRVPNVVPQTAIQIARRARPEVTTAPFAATVPAKVDGLPAQVSPRHVAAESRPRMAREAVEDGAGPVRRAQELAARNSRERANDNSHSRASSSRIKQPPEPVSKIILLQQWLAGQINKKAAGQVRSAGAPDEGGVQDIVYSPISPTYQEEPGYERCVGWTD